jgi:pimeloyl-ACP methyl ester carboxylesterase
MLGIASPGPRTSGTGKRSLSPGPSMYPPKTLFLPGAGGSAAFWKPAAEHLGTEAVFLSCPGLGNEPADPAVRGISDLVAMVRGYMDEPVNIVAQSMGGFVALKAALEVPDKIRRLVLCVTSGGVPVADLGGSSWQANYRSHFPRAAHWIGEPVEDLSARLAAIAAPTLLLWGDSDPISPVAWGSGCKPFCPMRVFTLSRVGITTLPRPMPRKWAG